MWKRLALVGATVAGALLLRKKAKDQQAEQDLWAQATDPVPPAAPAAPVAPAAPKEPNAGA